MRQLLLPGGRQLLPLSIDAQLDRLGATANPPAHPWLSWAMGADPPPDVSQQWRASQQASQLGSTFLAAGVSVGVIGVAGAALGAVCPLCVVATPALLGLGVVQKLRAHLLERATRKAR